jgi:regulator of sigma E protease
MGVLNIFSNGFYIFVAILVLMLMVMVHELGHYVAGKALNFKINEFSIGFGKVLYKRVSEKTGEAFLIKLFPLGGYCAFEGEDADKDEPRAFNNQKPWKRIVVLLSGVVMNFITAFIIAVAVFSTVGMYYPSVSKVFPDAIGETADESLKLKQDDIILAVNGKTLYLNGDLKLALDAIDINNPFTVTVVRNGVKQDVTVIKRNYLSEDDEGNSKIYVGLGILQDFASYRLGFFEAFSKGMVYCIRMAGVILGFFGQLITGQIGLNEIGGPISTIDYTAQVAKMGLRPLMDITTLIGVNLAVFNLLPIPALDGSRILFIIIEWIRKKPVRREIEGRIHFAGFLFLIGFVILADLLHIFRGV